VQNQSSEAIPKQNATLKPVKCIQSIDESQTLNLSAHPSLQNALQKRRDVGVRSFGKDIGNNTTTNSQESVQSPVKSQQIEPEIKAETPISSRAKSSCTPKKLSTPVLVTSLPPEKVAIPYPQHATPASEETSMASCEIPFMSENRATSITAEVTPIAKHDAKSDVETLGQKANPTSIAKSSSKLQAVKLASNQKVHEVYGIAATKGNKTPANVTQDEFDNAIGKDIFEEFSTKTRTPVRDLRRKTISTIKENSATMDVEADVEVTAPKALKTPIRNAINARRKSGRVETPAAPTPVAVAAAAAAAATTTTTPTVSVDAEMDVEADVEVTAPKALKTPIRNAINARRKSGRVETPAAPTPVVVLLLLLLLLLLLKSLSQLKLKRKLRWM
jgi:hypothetical protein